MCVSLYQLHFFGPEGTKFHTQPLDIIWARRALGKTQAEAADFVMI